MTMLPLLILVGLGIWYVSRKENARVNWLWILAGGLLVFGFGMVGRHGGMMGGRGGMMGMRGMMGMQGGMMGMHGGGMGIRGGMMGGPGMLAGQAGWHYWAGIGLHALLIVGAIVVAYFAWKRYRSAGPAEVQILRERLAKGEITVEEYDLLRQKLQG